MAAVKDERANFGDQGRQSRVVAPHTLYHGFGRCRAEIHAVALGKDALERGQRRSDVCDRLLCQQRN
jgi:hypothetical protein